MAGDQINLPVSTDYKLHVQVSLMTEILFVLGKGQLEVDLLIFLPITCMVTVQLAHCGI